MAKSLRLPATRAKTNLSHVMGFYDYIEVQPPENYSWLVNMGDLDQERLMKVLHSIIDNADALGKPVCATGDCHYVNPEDKILRDIYIVQKALGGGNHPLNPARRDRLGKVFPNPDQHFRSTQEMLDCFRPFLSEEKCREIVIKNTNWVADQVEPIQILKDRLYPPSANLPNSDVKLREIISENIRKTYGDHPDPAIPARIEQELKGIIENGYSVTYYIAHCIIKKANEEGYIVGSRGSVGSSFVATMSGITEVNPLAPHYLCHKCHHFEWSTDSNIKSGFDLPIKKCPECGEIMEGNGQNIPFQTFLGFNAEKVPDIDLNFPADYQSKAHAYTRTLLRRPKKTKKSPKANSSRSARHSRGHNRYGRRERTLSAMSAAIMNGFFIKNGARSIKPGPLIWLHVARASSGRPANTRVASLSSRPIWISSISRPINTQPMIPMRIGLQPTTNLRACMIPF
jgi:DNA polymerase-3 subunit alpha (Gram-positive type)